MLTLTFLTALGMASIGAITTLDNGAFSVILDTEKSCVSEIRILGGESIRFETPKDHQAKGITCERFDDAAFLRAEILCESVAGLEETRIFALAREGNLIRIYSRIRNTTQEPVEIKTYPVLNAKCIFPSAPQGVQSWRALNFEPHTEKSLKTHSRLHSSEGKGDGWNPYWAVNTDKITLYLALEWCGGWSADMSVSESTLDAKLHLPEEEAQLVLDPSEEIRGPALWFSVQTGSALERRAAWMRDRASIARKLYPQPEPSYPFSYNHWYAVRFDVNAEFLHRQITNLAPFKFDAFVVDAGWYETVGAWTPNLKKFKAGEFEGIMNDIEEQDVIPGIWTCPQFVDPKVADADTVFEEPPLDETFIQGRLLNMTDSDYTELLSDHVDLLTARYRTGWWKYDQLLFAPKSRNGVFKNVTSFQDALKAVRQLNPELYIENCQSGGRMTNELTLMTAQAQWLRDGGGTGLKHARDNISTVLNALDFVFPWEASRWTNNFDQNDPNDDEFTRYYCRSAMPGTWGIVTDLPKLSERQKSVILKERDNYRRLNSLKSGCRFGILRPVKGADIAGIIYFAPGGKKAAALIFRWDKSGDLQCSIPIPGLDTAKSFRITDADTETTVDSPGTALAEKGLLVSLPANRMSALYWIE